MSINNYIMDELLAWIPSSIRTLRDSCRMVIAMKKYFIKRRDGTAARPENCFKKFGF